MLYPVAMIEQDNGYVAKIPDLPTLLIEGDSMAQTISNVRAAIIHYLQSLADADLVIPEGQDIGTHLSNPQYFGHTWAIISLDSLRLSRQTLSFRLELPKSLIKQLSDTLGVENDAISQSEIEAFIIQAVREKLRTC